MFVKLPLEFSTNSSCLRFVLFVRDASHGQVRASSGTFGPFALFVRNDLVSSAPFARLEEASSALQCFRWKTLRSGHFNLFYLHSTMGMVGVRAW